MSSVYLKPTCHQTWLSATTSIFWRPHSPQVRLLIVLLLFVMRIAFMFPSDRSSMTIHNYDLMALHMAKFAKPAIISPLIREMYWKTFPAMSNNFSTRSSVQETMIQKSFRNDRGRVDKPIMLTTEWKKLFFSYFRLLRKIIITLFSHCQ